MLAQTDWITADRRLALSSLESGLHAPYCHKQYQQQEHHNAKQKHFQND